MDKNNIIAVQLTTSQIMEWLAVDYRQFPKMLSSMDCTGCNAKRNVESDTNKFIEGRKYPPSDKIIK